MAALGQLIRDARENRGMESQALAQRIGVSKGTISNLERGVLKTTPDPSMLRALSAELGVPVSQMLSVLGYLDEEPPKDSEALAAARAILGNRDYSQAQLRRFRQFMSSIVEMVDEMEG